MPIIWSKKLQAYRLKPGCGITKNARDAHIYCGTQSSLICSDDRPDLEIRYSPMERIMSYAQVSDPEKDRRLRQSGR